MYLVRVFMCNMCTCVCACVRACFYVLVHEHVSVQEGVEMGAREGRSLRACVRLCANHCRKMHIHWAAAFSVLLRHSRIYRAHREAVSRLSRLFYQEVEGLKDVGEQHFDCNEWHAKAWAEQS